MLRVWRMLLPLSEMPCSMLFRVALCLYPSRLGRALTGQSFNEPALATCCEIIVLRVSFNENNKLMWALTGRSSKLVTKLLKINMLEIFVERMTLYVTEKLGHECNVSRLRKPRITSKIEPEMILAFFRFENSNFFEFFSPSVINSRYRDCLILLFNFNNG